MSALEVMCGNVREKRGEHIRGRQEARRRLQLFRWLRMRVYARQ